jgi:succinate-semialdehyde dehydrogenase / glutarate-semialdehyde dehydrogenase
VKTTAPSPTAATGQPAATLQLPIAGLLAGQRGGAGAVVTASPLTGQKLADMPQASVEDVDHIFLTAARAQKHWAATDPMRRVEPFLRFADAILDRQAEILDVLQSETGKVRTHAFEEVLDAAGISRYYGKRAPRLLRTRRRPAALPLATSAEVARHAVGVVCVITPWNYPLALAVTDAVPALLAGNAVVHKPDTQTALTTLWARNLLVECGLPQRLWQVVTGDPAVIGDELIDRADQICFTGSTAAGRAIAARAGQRLIDITAELGGKNAMLVLRDANLDKAVEGAVRACFANAGQLCLSMERICVADTVYPEFVDKLAARIRNIKLGTGLDFGPEMGSLTLDRQFARVCGHVDDAVHKGATVLAGGSARPDIGPLFFEPTLLAGVTPQMAVYREETFGPVVSVYRFTDEAEAVALANDTEYGLNASIWSRDLGHARRLAAHIHAGTVSINEGYGAAYTAYGAPMGGVKTSGIGRRHGSEGLLKYTEAQTVASQRFVGFDVPRGVSQKHYARLLTAVVRALRLLRIR